MKTLKITLGKLIPAFLLLAGTWIITQSSSIVASPDPCDDDKECKGHHSCMGAKMLKHGNPEMREAFLEFRNEEIYPVLKEKRLKLDEELSEEEKETIASSRKELKAKKRSMMKKMHGHKDGEEGKGKEHKKSMHKEMKKTMAPLMEIAKEHQDDIDEIHEELEEHKKSWHKELRKIRKEKGNSGHHNGMKGHHKQDGSCSHSKGSGKEHDCSGECKKGGECHKGDKKAHHKGVHFLLMDPEAETPEEFFLHSPHQSQKNEEEGKPGQMKLFPNPSDNTVNIEYEVEKAGTVRIELLNKDGQVLRTIIEERKEKGEYQERVQIDEFDERRFYIRYTTPKGVQGKKLLKNH